ncbi:MAG TPA: quinone oxidoreductase [Thermoanaerobaculia bacterium]|jgi:NADPH2:quinone reductase|nr:quinone oxidoreductase [Thermoanaerobaculia bacterium]
MRAIVVTELGEPDVLVLRNVPEPVPARGQALVRLHAAGVNFSETERRRGVYRTPIFPWIPGSEGAGLVEAVGPETDASWIGKRVAFWAMEGVSGTYAELCVAPVEALVVLPAEISFPTGAALLLQGLTAYGLVHIVARAEAGMTVLIHAAGGGVGRIAIQLARRLGARMLGTASTRKKRTAITEVGGEAFAYGADLAGRVRAATDGRGVDVVLDSVGRETQAASLACLATFGRLIFFGDASGPPEPFDPGALYDRCLSVGAYVLNAPHPPGFFERARRKLIAAVVEGWLDLRIAQVIPLADAAQAHRRLESRKVAGKLVLGI